MKALRTILTIFLITLAVSTNAKAIENGIECEVKPLSEFWASDDGKSFDRIIGCVFSSDYSIPQPNTHLTNAFNATVRKFEISHAPNIKFLPDNIAEIFPNVKKIKGYQTGLQALTYSNLRQLSKIEEVDFRKGALETVEENSFQDTPKLKELALSSNKLKTLPENLFANLDSLRYLYLAENEFTRLEPRLFADTKSLENLYLQENKLKAIEAGTFNSLISLKNLALGSNELVEIQANAFANNNKMRTLGLDNNKITTINANLLSGMPELYQVEFSGNPLEVVDFQIFKDNKELREVHLGQCKIGKIVNVETVDSLVELEKVLLTENVCIDEDYDFKGLQFKLKRDVNKKCVKH